MKRVARRGTQGNTEDRATAGAERGCSVTRPWQTADRISDRIVNLVNEELAAMRTTDTVNVSEVLAGQLLALLALVSTAPPFAQPSSFQAVERAARACLEELVDAASVQRATR